MAMLMSVHFFYMISYDHGFDQYIPYIYSWNIVTLPHQHGTKEKYWDNITL